MTLSLLQREYRKADFATTLRFDKAMHESAEALSMEELLAFLIERRSNRANSFRGAVDSEEFVCRFAFSGKRF